MAHRRDTNSMGPATVCNVCGHKFAVLSAAGNPCPHCGQGDLIHRRFWHTRECPCCHWSTGLSCGICYGIGFTAIPREDITIESLREYHPQVNFI